MPAHVALEPQLQVAPARRGEASGEMLREGGAVVAAEGCCETVAMPGVGGRQVDVERAWAQPRRLAAAQRGRRELLALHVQLARRGLDGADDRGAHGRHMLRRPHTVLRASKGVLSGRYGLHLEAHCLLVLEPRAAASSCAYLIKLLPRLLQLNELCRVLLTRAGAATVWMQLLYTPKVCPPQGIFRRARLEPEQRCHGRVCHAMTAGGQVAHAHRPCRATREGLQAGTALVGTVDSWLIWNLTGGAKGVGGTTRHVTDVTNASRTLLMDLAAAQWHEPTIEALGLGAVRGALPEITSNAEVLGEVADGGALHGARLTGCIGDQQSSIQGPGLQNPRGHGLPCAAPGRTVGSSGGLTQSGGCSKRRSIPATVPAAPTPLARSAPPARCPGPISGTIYHVPLLRSPTTTPEPLPLLPLCPTALCHAMLWYTPSMRTRVPSFGQTFPNKVGPCQ